MTVTATSRSDILLMMQEIERMRASLRDRNVTSWVDACDRLLGDCRSQLAEGEAVHH